MKLDAVSTDRDAGFSWRHQSSSGTFRLSSEFIDIFTTTGSQALSTSSPSRLRPCLGLMLQTTLPRRPLADFYLTSQYSLPPRRFDQSLPEKAN
ncbi:hypothetical protein ElyMa_005031400 [Elysia marginata]|uniref:Uncharacterized protein n=1 Tax=Elysia marginata TaxID=1093978 RepID=A0AAV4J9E4_9GAST|nr:hypothetical protein ElyMa_005031400 [Elysia marginata]